MIYKIENKISDKGVHFFINTMIEKEFAVEKIDYDKDSLCNDSITLMDNLLKKNLTKETLSSYLQNQNEDTTFISHQSNENHEELMIEETSKHCCMIV